MRRGLVHVLAWLLTTGAAVTLSWWGVHTVMARTAYDPPRALPVVGATAQGAPSAARPSAPRTSGSPRPSRAKAAPPSASASPSSARTTPRSPGPSPLEFTRGTDRVSVFCTWHDGPPHVEIGDY
ncbi:hypothetical protein [Streptomyces sp. NPDC001056]